MVSEMPGKRTLRILICDADRKFVQAAERILGSEGHTVVAEADLYKAARLALKSTPDVVVLPSEYAHDPNANLIIELINHMTPRPAILLTIRMAQFDLARKAWQKGVDGTLFKPLLRDHELKTAISQARRRVAEGLENDPQLDDEIIKTSRQT
jgi:AmiR/NasT family two-component response regulator